MQSSDFATDEHLAPDHRAGFVSIVGKPNVGKSSLINAYLGQKVSIVSPKPQTTRRRVLGILTVSQAQIIFVDTPGIHVPLHKLGQIMVEAATDSIPDADVILWLTDASEEPTEEDSQIAQLIQARAPNIPLVLGLNKCDLVPQDQRPARARSFLGLVEPDSWTYLSATAGLNRDDLLHMVIAHLPLAPRYYPEDQVTDQTERAIVAELIREQILMHTHQEVPHAAEAIVDEFKVRSNKLTYIHATVIVERASQKGILLGQGGRMIKRIGRDARRQIEALLETRVYLEIWVKVRPKWRRSENDLRRLGYR
jgi:GTP-binding protein Era